MQPFKFNKMPEENSTASQVEQPSVAAAPDWSLLNNLSNNQEIKIETPIVEKPQDVKNTDVVTDQKEGADSEIKIETPAADDKPIEEQAKTEPAKEEPTVNPLFEIKVDDLKDVPKTYEDGTFQSLAKDGWGVDLQEESFEAFKEHFVPKSELETVKNTTKETLLAQYNPETAAAIEMLELGLPQELILEPTRNIDNAISSLDAALKLSSAELVRAVLENTEGWTPDLIETELDELATNGKLEHKAQIERLNIIADKKSLGEQRETVLKTRSELVAKHTTDRQRIEQQKKEQDTSLFLKTLNDKSDFMGVPVPKEFKDAIALKFRGGLYDNQLSEAQTKVNAILFHELGGKFAKLLNDSALAKGKESEIKKAANIPPTVNAGGGQKVAKELPVNDDNNPFNIIKEAFGK